MDDIRYNNKKKYSKNRMSYLNFIVFIRRNWIKMLMFLILIFIIFFPNIIGELVGNWWNVLVSSFLEKLTY